MSLSRDNSTDWDYRHGDPAYEARRDHDRWEIRRHQHGRTLVLAHTDPVRLPVNRAFHFTLRRQGRRLSLLVDGVEILACRDTRWRRAWCRIKASLPGETTPEDECLAEKFGGQCCGHPGMCASEGWEAP